MRSPVKIEYDQGRIFKLPSGQEIDLREKFKTNGVYRLDTFECIQPLDWFADDGELFASDDFSLLVRLNRFGSDAKWCLKFYKNGREIKQYKVGDLVQMPYFLFLPQTSYGWHSMWFATAMYNSHSEFIEITHAYSSYNQFVLITAPQFCGRLHLSDGNVFLFNPYNGEIIQEWRHHPLIKFCIAVISFLVLFLLLMSLCVRGLRKLFRRGIKKSELV